MRWPHQTRPRRGPSIVPRVQALGLATVIVQAEASPARVPEEIKMGMAARATAAKVMAANTGAVVETVGEVARVTESE